MGWKLSNALPRFADSNWRSWRNWRTVCVCAVGVFIVAFSCSNLAPTSIFFPNKFMFLWDGQSYLETCSNLTKAFIASLKGNIYQAIGISTEPEFIKRILHDGPALALVPAAFFAVLNRPPSAADWQTFVGLTAAFQSISAVLLFLLTLRVTASLGCGPLRLRFYFASIHPSSWLPVGM